MRPFHRTLLTVLVLAAVPLAASAQTLYKSVGTDGRVVYSDKPPVTGAVEKTMKLENLPVSVVPGASPAPSPAPPDTTQTAQTTAPRGDVVLYMATWCGYCKAAKAYLAGKGIAYRELDIDTPSGKAAFKQLGARGVPVLLTNGQKIAGFTSQAYDAVFVARK